MTSSAIPAAGQLQFYDAFEPTLEAGIYTVSAAPALSDPSGAHEIGSYATLTQSLYVAGPHYTLNPGLIASQFPPPQGNATYGQYLPQITFTHASLPWLRSMGSDVAANTPWLALLLFHPDELSSTSTAATLAQTGPVGTVLDATTWPNTYATPAVGLDPYVDPTTLCQYIDLPAALFTRIAPQATELPYLAHYRASNAVNPGTGGDSEVGAFSVLLGNRLPSAEGRNIVHLVSLEGYADYLPGSAVTPLAWQTIRLVSLASWAFRSPVGGEQFQRYITGLSLGALTLPQTSTPTTPTATEQAVSSALGAGYVPLAYRRREGTQTAAWYRGPLTATGLARAAAWNRPFTASDAALVYDQSSGLFDISYAAAWQTGRLMALANAPFCTALLAWRAAAQSALLAIEASGRSSERFTDLAPAAGLPATPAHLQQQARAWLKEQLPDLLNGELAPLLASRRDRHALADRRHKLPGVLAAEELVALLESGGHALLALADGVLNGRFARHKGEE